LDVSPIRTRQPALNAIEKAVRSGRRRQTKSAIEQAIPQLQGGFSIIDVQAVDLSEGHVDRNRLGGVGTQERIAAAARWMREVHMPVLQVRCIGNVCVGWSVQRICRISETRE